MLNGKVDRSIEPDLKKLSKSQRKLFNKFKEFKTNFFNAMDDDFNSAAAIGFVFDFITDLNKLIYVPSINFSDALIDFLFEIKRFFFDFSKITGLFNVAPKDFILSEKMKFLEEKGISEEFILEKIRLRETLRESKKWEEADRIREELTKYGVTLEDTLDGTEWKIDI